MKLSFVTPHLSINSFPTIDVPPFTLITGVNGAGKTHFLQAINKGHVNADVALNPQQDTRFFDWKTLVPNDAGEFQVSSVYAERDQIIQWAKEEREKLRHPIQAWASKYDLNSKGRGAIKSILRITQSELGQMIADSDLTDVAWRELQDIAKPATKQFMRHSQQNVIMSPKIKELHERFGTGSLALDVRDFEDQPFGWGQTNVFEQSFAQLFTGYFEMQKQNMLRKMDEANGRTPTVPSITDEEFIKRYGEEPWVFVNRILAEARLDFEIDHPVEYSTTKFTPQLRKISSGVDLQFSELSSGERILMSFAFCLYYSQDTRQLIQRPKVLLLDEIDAPLHPSMSRQLVDTIQKSLVKEQGVNVILTTHSPSTVAVAPEYAVYVMRPDEPGLHKVGKRQAIAVLTSEIPTLSVDFSGRRQVFVESRYDAERYEKLYRYLSPRIASERSLAFVAAGQKKKEGEDGGGCENVARIVGELVTSGNDSVFGLIDWDLTNKGEDRIFVLAQNRRYAIENCLLDPLLVGALAIRTDRGWAQEMGLAPDKGYPELQSLTNRECQEIVDVVERRVLGLAGGETFGDRATVEYVGGNSALISTSYLTMRGHDLEERVKEGFPLLKRYHKQGELLMTLIDPLIFEFSGLAPVELLKAFQEILEFEDGSSS